MEEIGTGAGNGGDLGRKWVVGTGGPRRRLPVGDGRRIVAGSCVVVDGDGLVRKWSPELEDCRWLGFGRRWRTTVAGSCVVVDGGKKMGRWREGGKIWGDTRWEQE
jgi:hypothetical protein